MTSQFDRDVDYMKERLQDRYERRLGDNYRKRIAAEQKLHVTDTINIVLSAAIAIALALWLLL